jgi:hypothetical protein
MILTQRQLELLLKTHGKIVLPYRARLTPSAQDWVRHNKVPVGYDLITLDLNQKAVVGQTIADKYLWWSDGPDGVAKAAIGMSAREVSLDPMPILEDNSRAISAVRTLSQSIFSGTAHGGVIIAKNPAIASLLANKASNLRAVVASSLAHVEEAINTIGANVLVIEREKWSLSPLKNLIVRFCKLPRKTDTVIESELRSLGTPDARGCAQMKTCCGGCQR